MLLHNGKKSAMEQLLTSTIAMLDTLNLSKV
jgi:hypothetical protein